MTTTAARSRPRPEPIIHDEGHTPARPMGTRPNTSAPVPCPESAQPKKLPSRTLREALHVPEATIVGQETPAQPTLPKPEAKAATKKKCEKTVSVSKKSVEVKSVVVDSDAKAQPTVERKPVEQQVSAAASNKPTRVDRKTLARQIREAVDAAVLQSLLHSEGLQQTRQRAADAIADHFNLPREDLPEVDDLQKVESRIGSLQAQIELFATTIERAQSAMAPTPLAEEAHQQPLGQPQEPLHAHAEAPSESMIPTPVENDTPSVSFDGPPTAYDDLLRRLLEENIKLSRNQDID